MQAKTLILVFSTAIFLLSFIIGYERVQANTYETLNSANLVAHWKLDANEPNATVLDSSGNGYHGTAYQDGNEVNTVDLHAAGKVSGAFHLDKDTLDYVDCGDLNDFTPSTDGFSLSLWFNVGQDGAFVSKTVDSNTSEWCLEWTDYGVMWWVYDANYTSSMAVSSDFVLTQYSNVWTHLVATYDGTSDVNNMEVYLNGNLATIYRTDASGFIAIENTASTIKIGFDNGNRPLDSKSIDDVRIYNKELTADEVRLIYEHGMGIKYGLIRKE